MYHWNVDVSILAEPCIEWRDTIPHKIVQEISRKYDKTSTWMVATSTCYSGSFVKPEGALVYSNSVVSGRIIHRGTDPWGYGRWAYKNYAGKDGISLLIIGGYRVGHISNIPGASTAWYQQKVLLTKDKREIEPEVAFLTDMEEWLRMKSDNKTEILLFLDANEHWTDNSKIVEFANTMGLYKLNIKGDFKFHVSHPCITNKERDTTIDYCLYSAHDLECVSYATMTPYDLHSLGDHRGVLIDIDFKRLMNTKNEEIAVHIGKKLSTGHPRATQKYLQLVEERFSDQNTFERTKNYTINGDNRNFRSGRL